jgi:CRISPR/Cas system CSM-associated protein Csm3 (group 7 of RAMP superfamily)
MGVIHRATEYYSLEIIPRNQEPLPNRAHHDHFECWRGTMHVAIEAISKIFVGTGDYEMDSGGIYSPFSRTSGKLFLPGTCLKGVVRTYAEALSSSCEGGTCRADRGNICLCCSIFGSLGLQGRVTFCDTETLEPDTVTLSKYTMAVRWSGGFDRGRRFYRHDSPGPHMTNRRTGRPMPEERLEIVQEHTRFFSDVLFENLSEPEMGLLLLAMGVSPHPGFRFDPKLGGGKNRRLGHVRFHLPTGIEVVTGNAYISFVTSLETKQLTDWGQEVIDIYWNSLSPENQRKALSNIQAFQADP